MSDATETFSTGTPDLGQQGTTHWRSKFSSRSTPHLFNLAEEVVKASKSYDQRLRVGTITQFTSYTSFQLTLDDGVVQNPPSLGAYRPVLNDNVLCLTFGPTVLILESLDRTDQPVMSGIIRIGSAADSTNSGLHDFPQVLVAPVTGWVELTASGDAGFSGAAISGVQQQLYTNSFVMSSGFGWATAATFPASSGAATWMHLPPLTGSYPVTAGSNFTPVWRLQWTPNASSIWYDVFVSYRIFKS
jgi:hypothetical protein